MATLVKTGIGDGQTLTPVHITELYDAFTGDKLFDNITINNTMKVTHDGKVSISHPSVAKVTPYALNVVGTVRGDVGRFDELIVTNAQFVTSSVLIITGSNFFGSLDTDVHMFTGSLAISGASAISNYFLNKVAIGREDVQGSNMLEVEGSVKISTSVTASNIMVDDLFVTNSLDVDGVSNFQNDMTLQQDLIVQNNITASGNISASGTIFASRFESAGTSNEVITFNDNLNISGNITYLQIKQDHLVELL